MNESYKNFAQTAINEVNTPLFAKIGQRDRLIKGFVYFLSILNILAGFMFFFSPVRDITDSVFFGALIALLILIVIEILSIIAFQESVFAINNSKTYGYALALLAVIILAFNVYSTAEGNRNFIRKLATKPAALESNLSETINNIDSLYFVKSEIINRKYDSLNSAINRDYTEKINQLNADISTAIDSETGQIRDWRKNHEATKNKSLLIQKQEQTREQLANNKDFETKQLKLYTDSIKTSIYNKESKTITEVAETADNSGKVAYALGIILVFLVITVRLIRVLAMIAASNFTKKTSGKIVTFEKYHTIELGILDMFSEKKPDKKDNTETAPDTEKKKNLGGMFPNLN